MIDIKVEASEIDKIFGLWKRQANFHLLNHFLILAKQHIVTPAEIRVILRHFHSVIHGLGFFIC